MPAGSPSSAGALARLLRETHAPEAGESVDLNNELKQGAAAELEGNLVALKNGLATRLDVGGTDNALSPEQCPVYKIFDILQWDLWQKSDEPWPVGCVNVHVSCKIDVKSPKVAGKHGSRHINRGKKPLEVEIEILLWTRVHFAAFTEVTERYGKDLPIGKTGDAIRIFHPNTMRYGIQYVIVTEIEGPRHKGNQLFEARMKCREFKPEAQRNRSGPSRSPGIVLPESQIDRSGGINRSVAPRSGADPAIMSQAEPSAGIPAPIASGL